MSLREQNAGDFKSDLLFGLGAAVLGFAMAFKLIFFPVVISFYFFPLERTKRLILIAIAACGFIILPAISFLLYNDLFFSWLYAVTGQIPIQHSPAKEVCSSSLLCLAQAVTAGIGTRPVQTHWCTSVFHVYSAYFGAIGLLGNFNCQ